MRTSVLVAFLLAPVLVAQPPISGVVSPAAIGAGQTTTLTITGFQSVSLPDPCVYQAIRQGSPTGPQVPLFVACVPVVTPLNAGATRSRIWTPGPNVAPGTYWFQVGVVGFPDQFFCVDVQLTVFQAPTLVATTPARVGQSLLIDLSASTFPNAPYLAAASLTSNIGIPLGGGAVACLDQDFIFNLSFPSPDPSLFSNFLGGTDSTGSASGIAVHIPNLPALTWLPLHVQVAVIDPMTVNPFLTNALSFTIQP